MRDQPSEPSRASIIRYAAAAAAAKSPPLASECVRVGEREKAASELAAGFPYLSCKPGKARTERCVGASGGGGERPSESASEVL